MPTSRGWNQACCILGQELHPDVGQVGDLRMAGSIVHQKKKAPILSAQGEIPLPEKFFPKRPVIQAFLEDPEWIGRLDRSLGNPLGRALLPMTSKWGFSVPDMFAATRTVTLSFDSLVSLGLSEAVKKRRLVSPL